MTQVEPGQVASRRIYSGRVIDLDIDTVRFPDGSVGELEIIRHSGASAVVPFVSEPTGDDPQIILIRQYRYMSSLFGFAADELRAAATVDRKLLILRSLGHACLAEHAQWILAHRDKRIQGMRW